MAANIPQTTSSGSTPVTLVTTMPLGVPPLAQLTSTVPNTTTMAVPIVPNTIAANSMQQVQQVVTQVSSNPSPTVTPVQNKQMAPQQQQQQQSNVVQALSTETTLVSRTKLQDLVREVDASEQLDEEVEDLLLQLADDFVESTVNAACLLAKHRKCTTVEVKDVQLHLERNWNMWTPGFGTDELRPYKRAPVTEAHKQRLALIRKVIKKY